MPSFSLSRRGGRRRTPEPVERRLDRLLDDPLYASRRDNEFLDFVTRQFDRVFGTDPMEVDASGRGIDPRPRRTDIEPFRPRVRAGDLRLGAPVGRGAANGFADVLGLQKMLSRLGAYAFDVAEGEQSGEATPRVVDAIKVFQKQNGLKVDGLINPAGPTIKTLGQNLFGQGKAPAPPQRESAESTRSTLLSGAQAKGPPAPQTPQGAGRPPAQTQGPGTQIAHAPSQGTGKSASGARAATVWPDSPINPQFLDALHDLESQQGNYQEFNPTGVALGRYQIRKLALIDTGMVDGQGNWTGRLGIHSKQDFLNNPSVQERVIAEYLAKLEGYLKYNKATTYIGQQIDGIKAKITITMPGLVAAAHKEGAEGTRQYLQHLQNHGWKSDPSTFPQQFHDSFRAIETRLRLFENERLHKTPRH